VLTSYAFLLLSVFQQNFLFFPKNSVEKALIPFIGIQPDVYTTLADTFHKRNLYLLEETLFVNRGKTIINRELHILARFPP